MTLQDYRDYYQFLNKELSQRIPDLAIALLGEPTLKKTHEWRYGSKGSLTINISGDYQGRFYDFEQGSHGSALDLVTRVHGLQGKDLCQWVRDWLGISQELTWTPLLPVPDWAPQPDFDQAPLSFLMAGNDIEAMHAYLTLESRLIGYVVRLRDRNGHKMTPMLTFCRSSHGRTAWRWKGFGDCRLPYGLEKLSKGNTSILIVEGEKTADAAQKIFPELIVLSWSGGAKAVLKTDWSFLKDREVILWPDNDLVGHEAMQNLEEHLQGLGCQKIDTVRLPQDTPHKWDLADPLPAAWDQQTLTSLLSPISGSSSLITHSLTQALGQAFTEAFTQALTKDSFR